MPFAGRERVGPSEPLAVFPAFFGLWRLVPEATAELALHWPRLGLGGGVAGGKIGHGEVAALLERLFTRTAGSIYAPLGHNCVEAVFILHTMSCTS